MNLQKEQEVSNKMNFRAKDAQSRFASCFEWACDAWKGDGYCDDINNNEVKFHCKQTAARYAEIFLGLLLGWRRLLRKLC